MTWTMAVVTFALLQGLGKFIDDHHISSRGKDKVRLFLMRGFLFAEKVYIPDIPAKVFRIVLASKHRLTWKVFACWIAFFMLPVTIMSAVFSTRSIRENGFTLNSDGLMALSLPLALALVVSLIVCLLAVIPTRLIFKAVDERRSFIRHVAVPVALITFYLIVFWIAAALNSHLIGGLWRSLFFSAHLHNSAFLSIWMYVFFLGPIVVVMLAALSSVGLAVVMAILFLLVIFSFVKISVAAVRFFALSFFDAATDPDTSPFGYSAALLGILVLVFKALDEGFKIVWPPTP